ncbi:MAG: DUF4911 domain-containing protein [Deltaproteobacteria bacterium]|nr:DUF4911 domain-containing protein [Deltaproteobacteria bacterium]
MNTSQKILARYFKVPATEIVYLKAVLESYEGMALMRTISRGRPEAWIELLIAEDFKDYIHQVIESLKQEITFIEITAQELPEPDHPERTLL